MKKVVVLNQFALPRDQGGGTRHTDLFSRLDGWQTRIVAGNRNHYSQNEFETSDPRFALIPVPAQDGGARQRLASWIAYCMGAARFTLKARPDVVYASTPHLLAPAAGWALARLTGARYVLEVRDLWPESFVAAGLLRKGSLQHRALEMLERFVIRRADSIVVVTAGWEDHFRALGADMSRYVIIPNGTEPYDLAIDSAGREALRSKYGITGTTAIFAGAHGPKDGIDLILDAAQALPEVDFLLVGAGPAKPQAEKRAGSQKLTNVRFMDPVPKSELPLLLAACDIGIHSVTPLPVFDKGMSPNKLFDYLAAGLPVASNAGAAITTFVPDGLCGRVGGPASLKDSLKDISLASDLQREAWRKNGRTLILDRFSRSRAATMLQEVLDAPRSVASIRNNQAPR